MLRHARNLAVLSFAVGIAACGSSPDGGKESREQASSKAVPPPKGSRALSVAGSDLRLGDATRADHRGVQRLRVTNRDPAGRTLRKPKPGPREGVGAGASCANTTLQPAADNLAAVAAATLCLVNGERIDRGLRPLQENAELARAAAGHSRDMVEQAYFSHTSKDGREVVDRVRATGYIPSEGLWSVGENLAWGTGSYGTPEKVVIGWMNSEGHRANILNAEYREAGQGIVLGNPNGSSDGATYTMNYGVRTAASDSPSGDDSSAAATLRATTGPVKSSSRKGRAARKKRCRRGTRRVKRGKRIVCTKRSRAASRRR